MVNFQLLISGTFEFAKSVPKKETVVSVWFARGFIADRLSARQLIVQFGLKSQLAYIYITIHVRNFRHA